MVSPTCPHCAETPPPGAVECPFCGEQLAGAPVRVVANADQEHLRLLSLFHSIYAGITALFACFPLIHIAVGTFFVASARESFPGQRGDAPPELIGWFFIAFGSLALLLGWTMAILTWRSGRCIKERKSHLFCLIMAGINCLWIPLGTALGVFTFVVLLRPSVKELFGQPPSP